MKRAQFLPPTPFYYIRHGETDWNLNNLYMGGSDIPLNDRGIKQAHNAKLTIQNLGIQTICCSPLQRAKKTAEILNKQLNFPLIFIEELKECDWGIYEGQPKSKEDKRKEWMKGIDIEGAESYQEFINRALKGIIKSLSYPAPVLIVAHGGVYWAICKCLGIKHDTASAINHCEIVRHIPSGAVKNEWVVESL